ncbi:MAG: TIGR04283 family arsenosugar biosynthesis glycosyltransferase [Flavobacteriales bacterium]|nr:TIGR04283 family arsenosugar biosynthesis glycosyltransferase [Flavobacteriales bacterium]
MERINKIDQVGIVIPTHNEESFISELLNDLQSENFGKILVVDCVSSDQTIKIVKRSKATLIHSPYLGRGRQMNLGAEQLHTEYLLFLHADVKIPPDFNTFIQQQIIQHRFDLANFQLCFDSDHWFLKLNALFSKKEWMPFQFGDQGLLIKTSLFNRSGGFDESLLFMEGNEIIRRLRKYNTYKKLPIMLIVSDRKYQKYGVFKLQFSYYLIYMLERVGVSQVRIKWLFNKVLG